MACVNAAKTNPFAPRTLFSVSNWMRRARSTKPGDCGTEFAGLVLEAAYESTICAAIINATETGSNKLFLTTIGGGVFGNDDHWIFAAIERAIRQYQNYELDVAIVSYGSPRRSVADLFAELSNH